MKAIWSLAAVTAVTMLTGACATTDNYASRCERDYQENRRYATASGAALGALAGAAIAGENDRERGRRSGRWRADCWATSCRPRTIPAATASAATIATGVTAMIACRVGAATATIERQVLSPNAGRTVFRGQGKTVAHVQSSAE